jgi:hypothetical protein
MNKEILEPFFKWPDSEANFMAKLNEVLGVKEGSTKTVFEHIIDLKQELLEIHTILMCPAECKTTEDKDTHTVKMLKGLIRNWHNTEKTAKITQDKIETLQKHLTKHAWERPFSNKA